MVNKVLMVSIDCELDKVYNGYGSKTLGVLGF